MSLDDAALRPGTDRHVVLYSDGALIGDGFDVREGIFDAQARAAVRDWPPRLKGLREARVWVIGADSGHSLPRPTMRRVRSLFERILDRAGARLESFGPSTRGYPVGSGR